MANLVKKIKPGIYTMPADEYHLDTCPSPSLSSSLAKVLTSRSPLHAWTCHPRLNPAYASEEKEAFDIGKAAHDALLEGVNRIEIVRADSWRTNAAKEQRDAARAKGLIPLLEKHHSRVSVMVKIANDAIRDCPDLSGITLADGKPEQTVLWQEGDIWCRSRLDWLGDDHSLILDYKTTSGSAEPSDVTRTHLITNGWDVQAVFYLRGLSGVSRVPVPLLGAPRFVFLAQEIDPPYACSFIGMPPAILSLGEQKVNDAIRLWDECLLKNRWPTYPNRICYPELPAWAEMRYVDKMPSAYDELQAREGLQI